MSSKSRVYGLDLLRSIAIGFVVVAHGLSFMYPTTRYLGYLGNLGGVGVELFFVLSGFLIGGILIGYGNSLKEPNTWHQFMMRRWWRTLPNYYLFLFINIIISITIYGKPDPLQDQLIKFLTFTQNFAWRSPPFFRESWSLSIEEWFYLLFSVLLMLSIRCFRKYERALLIVIALFFIIPIALRVYYLDPSLNWRNDFRMTVIFRLDALMYGVGAALIRMKNRQLWALSRNWTMLAGISVFLVFYVLMYRIDLDSSGFAKIWLMNGFNFAFALMLPFFSTLEKGILKPTITKISKWSYSMYLCNLIIMHYMLGHMKEVYTRSLLGSISVFTLYLIIVCIISFITYRFFELPILGVRDRLFPTHAKSPKAVKESNPKDEFV